MSNPQHNESIQAQATPSHAPAAMRELTTQELLAIVGGPVIENGGGGTIVATPPASGSKGG